MSDRAVVSFGLNCVAVAMRAKLGVLGRDEPLKLILLADQLVPGDAAALDAVTGFAKRVASHQQDAGERLFDFILSWRNGSIRASSKEAQPAHFDWQDRADLA